MLGRLYFLSAVAALAAGLVTGAAAHPMPGAHSWVRVAAGNVPTAFGVTLDDAALSGLGNSESETVLPLRRVPGLPFVTLVVDWHPHGHPPAHVYDVPHFDFHFYAIDEGERMAIAPVGPLALATPDPRYVPDAFVTDGATIPMMGKHYASRTQPEFNGGTFTATPIYGYYGGHLAFVEAMITRAFLQSGSAVSAPLAQPSAFERHGWYPTHWSVSHDTASHSYTISFSALAHH